MLAVGRTSLCLLAILCLVKARENTLQDLSDFQFLNRAIDEEATLKLEKNSEDIELSKNETIQLENSEIESKLFGNKESQELGMDTVTLIWYLTTFTALFGFFIVMACTENTCSRRRTAKPAERRNATPSPCPSYKHFAPPTYASVMKKFKEPKVFIVPVHEGSNNFFTNPADVPQSHCVNTESSEKNETIVTVSR